MKKIKCPVLFTAFVAICLMMAALVIKIPQIYFSIRGHGEVAVEENSFTESAKQLDNPNRGFYHMHGFVIEDRETDYSEDIAVRFSQDTETCLTLIEVNLNRFRDREISEQGLQNIENLFQALRTADKQLIVRFLYVWDEQESEPDSLDIILRHMQQCEQVFLEYSDIIFTMQGIFVGDYGEMHHSKYLSEDDVRTLMKTLEQVTDQSTFLAVRTPAFWRSLTDISDPYEVSRGENVLASRLGLFNDGMLGSVSDIGTYAEQENTDGERYAKRSRQEELDFQRVLCKAVPNGGETVIDNECNDFENAVRDLAVMHVTYLNRDYDSEVLNKWAGTTVMEEGCYYGMDGLSYIERHLGYRLVLRDVDMSYDFKKDTLSVDVNIQNVGFAPLYREAEARIVLYSRESGAYHSYLLEQDVRTLAGGAERDEVLTFHAELALTGETEGDYTVFFELTDRLSGQRIAFGNEEELQPLGYEIGWVKMGAVDELPEEWPFK